MKRIIIFLTATFGITYAVEAWIYFNGGLKNPLIFFLLTLIMLIPALCSLLTRWITREGFTNMKLRFSFRCDYKMLLIAWFAPVLLTFIGAAVFYLFFPQHFDANMSQLKNIVQSMPGNEKADVTQSQMMSLFASQLLVGILFAPILNFIPSLGEELGWRGYLFPKLAALKGNQAAVLISGLIWGLWHAPIIAMGYNYGMEYPGFPWVGILGMVVFCIFVSPFLSWLTVRTNSTFAPAIAHGSLNGIAAVGSAFFIGAPKALLGPAPVGIIGMLGFIIAGIYFYKQVGETNFSQN